MRQAARTVTEEPRTVPSRSLPLASPPNFDEGLLSLGSPLKKDSFTLHGRCERILSQRRCQELPAHTTASRSRARRSAPSSRMRYLPPARRWSSTTRCAGWLEVPSRHSRASSWPARWSLRSTGSSTPSSARRPSSPRRSRARRRRSSTCSTFEAEEGAEPAPRRRRRRRSATTSTRSPTRAPSSRATDGLPLSMRLLNETHARLMQRRARRRQAAGRGAPQPELDRRHPAGQRRVRAAAAARAPRRALGASRSTCTQTTPCRRSCAPASCTSSSRPSTRTSTATAASAACS